MAEPISHNGPTRRQADSPTGEPSPTGALLAAAAALCAALVCLQVIADSELVGNAAAHLRGLADPGAWMR